MRIIANPLGRPVILEDNEYLASEVMSPSNFLNRDLYYYQPKLLYDEAQNKYYHKYVDYCGKQILVYVLLGKRQKN